MTDDEINRWAAGKCVDESPEMIELWGDRRKAILATLDHEGEPANDANAAIALCERWGLEIADCLQRGKDYRVRLFINPIGNPPQQAHHGPTFARALTNAACAAKEAMEASNND